MKKILRIFSGTFLFLFTLLNLNTFKANALGSIPVNYNVNVSELGWMEPVGDGATAGTTGRSLGIESINISSPSDDFTIEYKVHVSKIGDMDMVSEGENAGATGRNLPIEAISIYLKDSEGNNASGYKVNYRVHVQDHGWLPWVSNGEMAGTTGQAKRMEAIEIYIEEVSKGEEIVDYAKGFMGTPYLWGGTTPNGFDCSGFVQYVYNNFGISLPRTTTQQVKAGIEVSKSDLQIGDLVFTSAGHVGIYVGDDQIIHSPQTGDVVKISKIWKFYKARRVL